MTGRAVLKRFLYTDTPSDTHPDTASVTNKVRDSSVANSSDGLTFVKRRAKDGRFLYKNTGVRRAQRLAKLRF